MSKGTGCDVIEVFDSGAQESANTVKYIPQFLNAEQKAQARTNIDAPSNADLAAEKAERIGIDEQMQKDIERASSSGGFLDEYDFGTATPTQQQLTDYAMSQIPNITDPIQIFNHTKIVNAFDGNTWDLTNTPNTEPSVFSWANIGRIGVSTASDSEKGIVKGSIDNLKVKVNADGTMEVNGLQGKLDEIDTKADADLANTDFITDCVLSAVNGVYEYASGKSLTIKSGIDVLFSIGRKPSRVFNNARYKKQQDSPIVISGIAGDKVTVFINRADGSVFQTPTSKVRKGVKVPDDYTYFKNLNTNLWQKKGAPTIDWAAGFGFSYSNPIGQVYQGICQSKVIFNNILILSISRRFQSNFSYLVYATSDGKTFSQLSTENWGGLAVANGILFSSSKGITSDLINFTPVIMPEGFSLSGGFYGIGNWFYLFDSTNRLFYKTQNFVDYVQMNYPTQYNYYTIGFDTDGEGNMIVALASTSGYTQYVQTSKISKDNGETWTDCPFSGTAIKYANGLFAAGNSTGTIFYSADKAETWNQKTVTSTRIQTIEFGSGEWNAASTISSVFKSLDNFNTISEKTTGFTSSGAPSIIFGNSLFFMTDYSSIAVTGTWTSSSTLYYAQPASQDEVITITEILTCEIDSFGNITNIMPKWPVDLLNTIDISQIIDRLNKLEAVVALL